METLDGEHFDVLISGTGIQESLLALALSRSGKKVLHIDKNDYYGGPEAALSLQEAEAWVQRTASNGASAYFDHASISQPAADDASHATSKLAFSRAYSLSLSPQLIYTQSALVPVLVSSKLSQPEKLEFLAVGSWWVYSPPLQANNGADSETDNASASSHATGRGRLVKVPTSREDIAFLDGGIDLRAKRSLMKVLRFIGDYENQMEIWEEHSSTTFTDFLSQKFKVPASLHDPLLALTLTPHAPSDTSVAFALPRIARHLRSTGVLGPFAAIVVKWGGLAEIAQVACRDSAVGGAIYKLNQSLNGIEDETSAQETSGEHIRTRTCKAIRLDEGGIVRADCIVSADDDFAASTKTASSDTIDTPTASSPSTVSRSVSVVSSPLAQLFPSLAEGSPPPAGAVVVFSSTSLLSDDVSSTATVLQPPVHLVVHSSGTGECPKGQSVIYASTLLTGENGLTLLEKAVGTLLHSLNEQPVPSLLWTMSYEQKTQTPSYGGTAASVGNDNLFKLPAPSLDSVFDDGIISTVKEVWQSIMGPDADGFMVFEDRESVGDDGGQDVDW